MKNGDCGNIHVIKTCARDHPLPPMSYLKISGKSNHEKLIIKHLPELINSNKQPQNLLNSAEPF